MDFIFKLKKLWEQLKGNNEDFPLQSRIHHSVCVATTLVMVYVLVFSLVSGMFPAVLVTGLLLPAQVYLYYLSRVKRRTVLSFYLYCALIYLFFIYAYLTSSGVSGSTLLSFCIVYFLSLAIAPRRQFLILTLVNIVIVLGLLFIEYNYPGIVRQHYSGRQQLIVDIGSTYAVNVILIFAGLGYIISNYTTERNRAESQVAILDELNEEKSRIIQVVTHDFQTPLINLKQYLRMISLYDIADDKRKEMEGEIARSIANTQNLLINLLDLTKGTKMDDICSSYREFNVFEVLKETILVYEDVARTKNVKLDVLIPQDLTIRSHPAMFSIAVRNLINNAITIAPSSSVVTLSYSEVHAFHQISVVDTGPGLSKQQQEQLSALFAGKKELSQMQLKGIGLSLVHKYMSRLKGAVSFESNLEGTSFRLDFPK